MVIPSNVKVIGALGITQMVAYASSFYLFGVLADPMAADTGTSTNLIFSALSAGFLIAAAIGPFVGRWLDAGGGKTVLLVSNAVFCLGLTTLAIADGPIPIVSGILIIGCGMGLGLSATPFAILVGLYGLEARRSITAVSLLGGLGGAVGWPLTQIFEEAFGWRGAAGSWALAHVILCVPLALLLIPRGARIRARKHDASSGDHSWDRRMVQLAVLFAGAYVLSTAMSAHLPRILSGIGLTPERAANTAAMMGVAAVALRALDLTFLQRLSPIMTVRIATLFHPAGALAVLVAGSLGAPLLAIGQGAGNGLLSVASGVLPLLIFGEGGYAYRSALILSLARFLQAGGPFLFGLLLAQSPTLALATSTSLCFVMFLMTFGLIPRSAPHT